MRVWDSLQFITIILNFSTNVFNNFYNYYKTKLYAPTVLYVPLTFLQPKFTSIFKSYLFNVFDKVDGVTDACSSLRYCSQHKGWSGNVTLCIAGGFFVCVGAAAGPEEFNGSRLKLWEFNHRVSTGSSGQTWLHQHCTVFFPPCCSLDLLLFVYLKLYLDLLFLSKPKLLIRTS